MPSENGNGRNFSWIKIYFISVVQFFTPNGWQADTHMYSALSKELTHAIFQDITEHHRTPLDKYYAA